MAIHLKGITWDHPRGFQPLSICSQHYTAFSGVEVSWVRRSLKDFGDQPIEQLIEQYDLLIIDHPHVGIAAAAGALTPLDKYISADTLDRLAEQSAGPSHESYTYEGHQWGLAIDTAMQTAVYRDDLIQSSQLPTDWEAVINLGEQVLAEGLYIAIPLGPTDSVCSFLSLCANLGEIPGKNNTLVPEATGEQALTILRSLKRVAHPASVTWNPIHMLDYMSSADDVIYCPLTFCYTNYSRDGYKPKPLTFTTIPGIKGSILGGAGYAVSAHCKHPQAASDFGVWLCEGEVQRNCYMREGGQPGNKLAWLDADANRMTKNFFYNTLPTLEQSFIRPRHNGFVTFQEGAGNIINQFLLDDTPVDVCFEKLIELYDANK